MPNTYVALATQTLGTAASSVTFSSISSSYTDLVLITSAKNNTGAQYRLQLSFNGDRSTSVYSVTKLTGNGSTAVSSRASNATYGAILIGTIGNTNFDNVITHIMNYSNTTTNKTVLSRGNETAAEVNAEVGLWRSTAAITSLTLDLEGGINFLAGSTFSLYGIANADQGSAKATGGIITEDSQYWYHTFGASGTFTPKQALTCDYLVLAGGGGGTYGGGGAGGLRSTVTATGGGGALESPISVLSGTPYAITVGAGGVSGTNTVVGSATNGVNSVFSTITSTGGGRGGIFGNPGQPGISGGSGGGGGGADSSSTAGGGGSASPSGQGFGGGSGSVQSTTNGGGGGGGAGAAGGNALITSFGGQGGNGIATVITGSSVTYGGGGSGGGSLATTGGTGGGGTGGASSSTGTAGTANLGGGGGGGGNTTGGLSGGNGGSGIVIVRYAK